MVDRLAGYKGGHDVRDWGHVAYPKSMGVRSKTMDTRLTQTFVFDF